MPPTQLHHPSPKRKRDQAPPIPLLNTALRLQTPSPRASPVPPSGADSPRNAVADQLRGMSLTSLAAIPMSPLSPADQLVHKKPKLEGMRTDSGTALNEAVRNPATISWRRDNRLETIAVSPESEGGREIPDTPQVVSQPRMLPDIASFAQHSTFTSSPVNRTSQLHQSPVRSPRTQTQSPVKSRPMKKSPSPPPASLTWQDSEITGHLAGPSTDPDDDGTGLNGIGFKPTPAIAYARSQKRRQQLNEWKARETREARAKRSERRRRGIGGRASREATVEREMPAVEEKSPRRTVKFAV